MRGITQIRDMFNHGLRGRVIGLCQEFKKHLLSETTSVEPPNMTASPTSDPMKPIRPMSNEANGPDESAGTLVAGRPRRKSQLNRRLERNALRVLRRKAVVYCRYRRWQRLAVATEIRMRNCASRPSECSKAWWTERARFAHSRAISLRKMLNQFVAIHGERAR